jgi:hypothetical protein
VDQSHSDIVATHRDEATRGREELAVLPAARVLRAKFGCRGTTTV